ncbi:MAG: hypothetical protein ACI4PH_08205 [Faecousia sp.]
MQNTIKKKRGAVVSAAVIVGLVGLILAAVLVPLIREAYGEGIAVGFLVVYGLALVAVIVGVLAALGQRLKEIESGEEEDAKKY